MFFTLGDVLFIGFFFLLLGYIAYWPEAVRPRKKGMKKCDEERMEKEMWKRKYEEKKTMKEVDVKRGDDEWVTTRPGRTGKRYLICGVGFLGSHLVDALIERGETNITLLDRRFSEECEERYQHKVQEIIKNVDVVDRQMVESVFKTRSFDVVINTIAFLSYHQRLRHQYKQSYDINVLGVRNMVCAAKAAGVGLYIHISTSHVHVDVNADFDMNEESGYALYPFNHYTATKILGEKEVMKIHDEQVAEGKMTMACAILRPASGIFGARDNFIHTVIAKRKIESYNRSTVIDWVYVKNVVLGVFLLEQALEKECKQVLPSLSQTNGEKTTADDDKKNFKVIGQAFLVSNNSPVEWVAYLKLYGDCLPGFPIVLSPWPVILLIAWFSEMVQRLFRGRLFLFSFLTLFTYAYVMLILSFFYYFFLFGDEGTHLACWTCSRWRRAM